MLRSGMRPIGARGHHPSRWSSAEACADFYASLVLMSKHLGGALSSARHIVMQHGRAVPQRCGSKSRCLISCALPGSKFTGLPGHAAISPTSP